MLYIFSNECFIDIPFFKVVMLSPGQSQQTEGQDGKDSKSSNPNNQRSRRDKPA